MVNDWSIVFYIGARDESPVREFIAGLDDKTRVRIGSAIERLRILNVQAREPLVKHLDGKLYELRIESSTNIYRVLYFFFTSRRIVLLHAFQKKSQKTPAKEIETAIQRMNRYLESEKGVSK